VDAATADEAGRVTTGHRTAADELDHTAAGSAAVGIAVGELRARSQQAFRHLRSLADDEPRRAEVRDALVALHLPLVEYLAGRFRNRGEAPEDLVQVGTIGLIKAVDRFDPDRGVEFSTYATPTVLGEIKRWFRDKGWSIRVPRRLQELRLALTVATDELSQDLGRSPTVAEIAARLDVSQDMVLEGLESAAAYTTVSLDAPDLALVDGASVGDQLGEEDDALETVELRESLRPVLDQLPRRERRIVVLRFFRQMTQSQIAAEVGLSQMHVSRLLARSLATLRAELTDGDA